MTQAVPGMCPCSGIFAGWILYAKVGFTGWIQLMQRNGHAKAVNIRSVCMQQKGLAHQKPNQLCQKNQLRNWEQEPKRE